MINNKLIKEYEPIYFVLYNQITFLKERSALTLGEAKHIRRTLKGAKWTPSFKGEAHGAFYSTCRTIIDGLNSLIDKIDQHESTISEEKEAIRKILAKESVPEYIDTAYMEMIILHDCLQERSLMLAEKLAYFYRAYKNLVEKHGYAHIPLPDISRRVKTSNLMLYFDHSLLKDGYTLLEKEFFHISDKKEREIISTWDFSASEHIKQLDDKHIYVSFSFWFFEKQYFYPIGYHELAHPLYRENNRKSLKPNEEEKEKIKDFINKKVFLSHDMKDRHEAFFITIYQDAIADIAAYAIAGKSYIYALFYQGFLRNIHQNFYQDLEENAVLNGISVKDKDRECARRHKALSILSWQNISEDSVSLFARLKLLIKLCRNEKKEGITEELKGIEAIIDIVYPEKLEKKKGKKKGFIDIVRISEEFHAEYRSERAQTLLVWRLLDELIFPDDVLKKNIKERMARVKKNRRSLDSKNKPYIETFTNEYLSSKNLKWEEYKENTETYFDFAWHTRFLALRENINNKPENQDTIYSGRIWRTRNLYELGVFNQADFKQDGMFLGYENIIYELIFFKFKDIKEMPCPLKELDSGGKGYFGEEKIKPVEVTYNCGPYNYTILAKNSTREVDDYLVNLDDKENPYLYFTERHALLLLSEITSKEKSVDLPNVENLDKSINLITFITVKDSFETDKKSILNVINAYKREFKKVENIFDRIRLFASMGSENMVIYTSGVSPKELNTILEKIYTARKHIEDSYSVITFNKDILPLFNSNSEGGVSLSDLNADILLLCSLCQSKRGDSEIKDIDKSIKVALGGNGKIYRLFGIFDYKIRFSEETENIFGTIQSFMVAMRAQKIFNDIQIEYQPRVKTIT